MLEYFELIEKAQGRRRRRELEALARDKDFLARHAITGDTVEGYLFPDTYEFRVGEKPRAVLERLITRHQEVWNELLAKHPSDAAQAQGQAQLDRSRHPDDGVDRREGSGRADRAAAHRAGVHQPAHARRLQAAAARDRSDDPLRLPGAREEDRGVRRVERAVREAEPAAGCDRLHRAQLDDKDNPYNTYRHEGLPPGPIANPGRRSIEAMSRPTAATTCTSSAKNEREHVFAKTFDEHERNVEKYQK